jgi:hypothetical protein
MSAGQEPISADLTKTSQLVECVRERAVPRVTAAVMSGLDRAGRKTHSNA